MEMIRVLLPVSGSILPFPNVPLSPAMVTRFAVVHVDPE